MLCVQLPHFPQRPPTRSCEGLWKNLPSGSRLSLYIRYAVCGKVVGGNPFFPIWPGGPDPERRYDNVGCLFPFFLRVIVKFYNTKINSSSTKTLSNFNSRYLTLVPSYQLSLHYMTFLIYACTCVIGKRVSCRFCRHQVSLYQNAQMFRTHRSLH